MKYTKQFMDLYNYRKKGVIGMNYYIADLHIAHKNVCKEGNKHLILGNHDKVKDSRYAQLFVEIT